VRAIDSVFAQESVRTEVIVVDDCSEDDTYELLKERYQSRIILVRLEVPRRVAYATNRGFEASKGQYIAILNDDDYWIDTRKLEKQIAVFRDAGSKLGVVGTWWTEMHSSGDTVVREPAEPEDWTERLLQGGGIICGSTPLIPRQVWIDTGGFDERMPRGVDSDLFRRIIFAGYSGKLIPQHTTIVDVGHGLVRMTANRGFREAQRIAWVHGFILWKYRWQYLRYPKIMFSRIQRLFLGSLAAFVRTISDLKHHLIIKKRSP
jgi:glycosyltransferase involved in cell wall biosynthesis